MPGNSPKGPERPPQFVDYVIELLGPFGTVEARRMFSGHGIFLDGLMFAIVARDTLWLKADEMSREEFERAGCEPFQYDLGGKQATLGFYRAPVDALESPAQALPWARAAYAAALRANARKAAAQKRAAEPKRSGSAPPRGGQRPSRRPAVKRPPRASVRARKSVRSR